MSRNMAYCSSCSVLLEGTVTCKSCQTYVFCKCGETSIMLDERSLVKMSPVISAKKERRTYRSDDKEGAIFHESINIYVGDDPLTKMSTGFRDVPDRQWKEDK